MKIDYSVCLYTEALVLEKVQDLTVLLPSMEHCRKADKIRDLRWTPMHRKLWFSIGQWVEVQWLAWIKLTMRYHLTSGYVYWGVMRK